MTTGSCQFPNGDMSNGCALDRSSAIGIELPMKQLSRCTALFRQPINEQEQHGAQDGHQEARP
jgi:hypothetical protein